MAQFKGSLFPNPGYINLVPYLILINTDEISPDYFDFVINHVFLPPKLPQRAEEFTGEKNFVLLQLLQHASDLYARYLPRSDSAWPAVVKMLEHFGMLENINSLPAHEFTKAVREMKDGGLVNLLSSLVMRLTGVGIEMLSASTSRLRTLGLYSGVLDTPSSSPLSKLPPPPRPSPGQLENFLSLTQALALLCLGRN